MHLVDPAGATCRGCPWLTGHSEVASHLTVHVRRSETITQRPTCANPADGRASYSPRTEQLLTVTMLRRTLFLSALLAVVTDAETGPCEPITLPQCQDLPYNTTLMSDGLGGSSQSAAGRAIDARTNSIHDTNCSRVLTLVACAAYLPPCHSVAVSADICRLAQTDCHPVLVQLGIAWPGLLSCETSQTDAQSTDGKSRQRGGPT